MSRRQTQRLRPSQGGAFASPVGPATPIAAMTAGDHDGVLYGHDDPQWVAMFVAYRERGVDWSDVARRPAPTFAVGERVRRRRGLREKGAVIENDGAWVRVRWDVTGLTTSRLVEDAAFFFVPVPSRGDT